MLGITINVASTDVGVVQVVAIVTIQKNHREEVQLDWVKRLTEKYYLYLECIPSMRAIYTAMSQNIWIGNVLCSHAETDLNMIRVVVHNSPGAVSLRLVDCGKRDMGF